MSYVAGGDSSNWVGILSLPHYNMNDMPGVSFHVALHLAQIEFIDIPVDLVAGRKDQVIRSSMIKKHYNRMKNAGVNVSIKEFEYGHLDFTKAHSDEILAYVISRLLLVAPGPEQKSLSLKKRKRLEINGRCS